MKRVLQTIMIAVCLSLCASPVIGTVYNYDGNYYNIFDGEIFTSAERVLGSFSIDGSLPSGLVDADITALSGFATSWTGGFSPGDYISGWVFTESDIQGFDVSTDSMGNINAWNLSFNINSGSILDLSLTVNNATGDYSHYFSVGIGPPSALPNGTEMYDRYAQAQTAGSWSTAPVPEPSTILLISTGLVGLVGFRKKLKK